MRWRLRRGKGRHVIQVMRLAFTQCTGPRAGAFSGTRNAEKVAAVPGTKSSQREKGHRKSMEDLWELMNIHWKSVENPRRLWKDFRLFGTKPMATISTITRGVPVSDMPRMKVCEVYPGRGRARELWRLFSKRSQSDSKWLKKAQKALEFFRILSIYFNFCQILSIFLSFLQKTQGFKGRLGKVFPAGCVVELCGAAMLRVAEERFTSMWIECQLKFTKI